MAKKELSHSIMELLKEFYQSKENMNDYPNILKRQTLIIDCHMSTCIRLNPVGATFNNTTNEEDNSKWLPEYQSEIASFMKFLRNQHK
jgi:hypothetical protein